VFGCDDVRYNRGAVEVEGGTSGGHTSTTVVDSVPQPLTCDGSSPVLGVGAAVRYTVPPRFGQAAAIDPVADRLVVVRGVERSGFYPNSMYTVGLEDGVVTTLRQEGDVKELQGPAPAVWDPLAQRIVVVGGAMSFGDLADTIAVQVSGATATITRLPDHPTTAYDAVA
ncbi:MAG: hypothetical protein AAFX99_37495, partial [Myxococcota bacterium]